MALVDDQSATSVLSIANAMFFWIQQLRCVAGVRPYFLSKTALQIRIEEMERNLTDLKKIEAGLPDDSNTEALKL